MPTNVTLANQVKKLATNPLALQMEHGEIHADVEIWQAGGRYL